MMNIVAHNLLAMNANRQFGIVNKKKAKSTEKLSSGYKINRAADDAAGLSISEKMRRQIRGLSQGVENTQDGVSLCQIADGALNEMHDMLHRLEELSVKAANGTNTLDDRQAVQAEIDQVLSEIDRISTTSQFNEHLIFRDGRRRTAPAAISNAAGAKSSVKYLDENGNGQTCASATVVESGTTTWNSGWYVVNSNVTISGRVNVGGDVHLILADGCNLTASKGIRVNGGNSLTIYAQSNGGSMGSLTATAENNNAGIGGNDLESGGTITINGGNVTANGGSRAAGIGGGSQGAGGTITINGGVVKATALGSTGDPAAIGGGGYGEAGTIVIRGGTVSAHGCGKGIGGGEYRSNGSITISGGNVTANGIGAGSYNANTNDTNISGNAVVICTSNSINQTNKSSWSGVIFEGNNGKVYGGNITPNENFEIPSGKTLTIDSGKTLTINSGVTLTNNGTINNNGTITNKGTFTNNGIFNGNPIQESGSTDIEGGGNSVLPMKRWWIQSGSEPGVGMFVEIDSIDTVTLGLSGMSVTTVEQADNAITRVKGALEIVSGVRSKIGAQQNRLEHTINNENNIVENTADAESRIRDADIADEMVTKTTADILAQAGASVMAQANQHSQMVLSLLG